MLSYISNKNVHVKSDFLGFEQYFFVLQFFVPNLELSSSTGQIIYSRNLHLTMGNEQG